MVAMSQPVLLKRNVPSGTLLLNCPERRNALSREMVAELLQAFIDFQGERQVRALILTGAGNSFCSGSDLKQMSESAADPQALSLWQQDVEQLQELLETMLRYPKPILVAASGWVIGTGLALLLAADYVVAAPDTRFWLPESLRGLSVGLTVPLLAFRCGAARASRLLYDPQPLEAASAAQMGFVHEIVEPNLLWARAHQIATEIARGSASAQLLAKQMLNQTVGENLLTQLSIGAAQTATARTTDLAREGILAFLEKREPQF